MGGPSPWALYPRCALRKMLSFLPSPDDAAEKLKEHPFYYQVPIPADAYSDLEADMNALNVGNMQFITHADIDEDLVYQFTKILYENREKVLKRTQAGRR